MKHMLWILLMAACGILMICFAIYGVIKNDYSRATYDLVLGIWLLETARRASEELAHDITPE